MDVALWEALPPAECAKIEAEKMAEEEKRAAGNLLGSSISRLRELGNWLFGRKLVQGP